MSNTDEFLKLLLEHCTAFRKSTCFTLTAIHPDGKHPTPSRHLPVGDRTALTDALQQLHQANEQGWGAYFAVGLRKSGLRRFRRGGVAEVLALPALYTDIDDTSPATLRKLQSFAIRPSIIVHSGGGFHAYWLLEEPTTNLAEAQHILRGLAHELGGDALSPAQSLRLPGTWNTKPGRDALCHLVEVSDNHYSLFDFHDLILSKPARWIIPTLETTASNERILNPHLIEAVCERLYCSYSARQQRGSAWIASYCPCGHARDGPGQHFFFNPAIGCGRCHGRHGTLRLTDLCFYLSINISAYGGIFR